MNLFTSFQYYGQKVKKGLEFEDKVPDFHRSRWKNGDWTDDSDQMILILQLLLEKHGEVCCSFNIDRNVKSAYYPPQKD